MAASTYYKQHSFPAHIGQALMSKSDEIFWANIEVFSPVQLSLSVPKPRRANDHFSKVGIRQEP